MKTTETIKVTCPGCGHVEEVEITSEIKEANKEFRITCPICWTELVINTKESGENNGNN